jgi:hypothetical protein
MTYQEIAAAVAATGLSVRGGFHPENVEPAPQVRPGVAAQSVVLIGSAGLSSWQAFTAARAPGRDPLDRWARAQVEPVATMIGARDVYPGDRPFLPFQRWAKRSEDVHTSPLGLLIHPQYGLWHSYRAALLIPERIDLPPAGNRPSPCVACTGKPCLGACPVNSFGEHGFDSASCHQHLSTSKGQECLDLGCKARNACPIAREQRYAPDQIRFHMAAFHEKPA